MQRRNQTNFSNRAAYYMGREIAEQGMRIKDSEKWNYELLPVVGVFVTEFEQPGFRGRVAVHGRMTDPETGKIVLSQFKCAFVQLDAFGKTREECETGFEKWIYMLKNMETLKEIPFRDYKGGLFERLGELSEVANLSQDEWAEYNATLKQARDYYATLSYARTEGWKEGDAKGRAEGEAKGRAESLELVARNLRALGFDLATIARSTGLTEEEIQKL